MSLFKACAGCAPVADQVDLRGRQLIFVPDYIYRQRRSLHELYLDYNQIKDLPPVSNLFVCLFVVVYFVYSCSCSSNS